MHNCVEYVCLYVCRIPLLYGSINGGRVIAVLFFFGVSLAGLSSQIGILEQSVHVLEDFGCMFSLTILVQFCNMCGNLSQEKSIPSNPVTELIVYF